VVVVIESTVAAMVSVIVPLIATALCESVVLNVSGVAKIVWVGVPWSNPLLSRIRPAGRVPLVKAQVYG